MDSLTKRYEHTWTITGPPAFSSLGQSLPELWRNGPLNRAQRKALLRCLIDKVVLRRTAGDCIHARVVVTFLTMNGALEVGEDFAGLAPDSITENAPPLDDFEPIVPATPVRLSDLVLEDRR